jgi:hypothetical protein
MAGEKIYEIDLGWVPRDCLRITVLFAITAVIACGSVV